MGLLSYISVRRLSRFWTNVKSYVDGILNTAKGYTDTRISQIETFSQEVVESLESITSPKSKTLYFVPSASSETGNVYDEFIYTANGFEQIGSTSYVPDHGVQDDEDNPGYLVLTIGDKSYSIERTEIVVPEVNVAYNNVTNPENDIAVTTTTSTGNITITISNNVEGASIYYTTDDSDPKNSNSKQLYSAPFSLPIVTDGNDNPATTTVKVRATRQGRWSTTMRVVTFKITRKLKAPVITVTPPDSTSTQGSVSISKVTDYSQAIHYTTDDTEPTVNSSEYSSAFSINSNVKVRAKAFKSNWNASDEATAVQQKFTLAAPTISVSDDQYASERTITLSQGQGASLYYNIDSQTAPTAVAANAYDSDNPPTISTAGSHTIRVLAVKSDWNDATNSSSPAVKKIKTPTVTVASYSQWDTSVAVTLACATDGTTIRYTTDGSTPTASSTAYTGTAISVSTPYNNKVKAKAFKTDWTDSEVGQSSSNIVLKHYAHAGLSATSDAANITLSELTVLKNGTGDTRAVSPTGTYDFANPAGATAKYIWFLAPTTSSSGNPFVDIQNTASLSQLSAFSTGTVQIGTQWFRWYRWNDTLLAGSSWTLKVVGE